MSEEKSIQQLQQNYIELLEKKIKKFEEEKNHQGVNVSHSKVTVNQKNEYADERFNDLCEKLGERYGIKVEKYEDLAKRISKGGFKG